MTPDKKKNYLLFMVQMTMSILVYTLLAVWYAAPYLGALALPHALTIVLIPHAMRHLGMTILSPSVVDPAVPKFASNPIAYGDLAAAIAAIAALVALRAGSGLAIPLVWISVVVGVGDLVNAFIVATKGQITNYQIGGFWYVPTFVVPLLFVTHGLTIWLLVR